MIEVIRRAYVTRKNWAPGDSFLVVTLMDFQVLGSDWICGEKVGAVR